MFLQLVQEMKGMFLSMWDSSKMHILPYSSSASSNIFSVCMLIENYIKLLAILNMYVKHLIITTNLNEPGN